MSTVKRPRKKTTAKRGRKSRKRPPTLMERITNGLAQLGQNIVSAATVGLAALAVIVCLMLFAGGYFWNVGDRIELLGSRAAKAMGFTVGRVTVKGGDHLANRDIMLALGDDRFGGVIGRSLLHVDAGAARERIERLGWVEVAAVQKLWPNTVHVSVRERQPRALWQDPMGDYFLVDRDGRLIARVSSTDYTDLPVVAGVSDPALAGGILDQLAARPDLAARVAVVLGVEDRRFDLRFRNDFTAQLPEGDPSLALDRLERLGAGTSELEYLDLRDDDWAYVKPKSS